MSLGRGVGARSTVGGSLGLRLYLSGPYGRVLAYVRRNDRCPACQFLEELDGKVRKKFMGSFDALGKIGASYQNPQRFKALQGKGKPMWEFKEHGHRIYCYRRVLDQRVAAVLLSGWDKDKEGRTDREDREIQAAHGLLAEFMAEFPGGNV